MARNLASPEIVMFWIRDYPELKFDGVELLCTVCQVNLIHTRKSVVTKHVATRRHKRLLGEAPQKDFNLDLVKFMVGCNISWRQLDNPLFREFIHKCIDGQYKDLELPHEATLRKSYLPQLAAKTIDNIRSELEGKHIWVSIDESTNVSGAKIANVLIGALEDLHARRGHLVASRELDHPNADSVAFLVSDSLIQLWGDNYESSKDKFLLFITDATASMKAAAQLLNTTFNFLHVTCLAHSLHLVAETVRECYPKVDMLISSVKKVFRKAPKRTRLFCELLPQTKLPPEPIVTRRGTWIEAALYYFNHLEEVKQVLQQLDTNEGVEIANAQEIVVDPTLPGSLQELYNSFSRIPLSIGELERNLKSTDISLTNQMKVVYGLQQYLALVTGDVAKRVQQKLDTVLQSNPGFQTLSDIEKLLHHQEVNFAVPDLHESSLQKYSLFRYAPLTSVDVERSFPLLTWLFSDRRRRTLTPAHVEQLLVIYCYYNKD